MTNDSRLKETTDTQQPNAKCDPGLGLKPEKNINETISDILIGSTD